MSILLKNAGQIDIIKIDIVGSTGNYVDIRNQVISLNIYEDMFSPFVTGSIVIKDALDMVNFFPLVGDETLNLKLSTPGFTEDSGYINSSFKIYKMTDREMLGDNIVGYILHFISIVSVLDLNIKISKSYNDNIGNLANNILSTYITPTDLKITPKFNVEPTLNAFSYISNFWSPIKNLNFLAENAINVNGSPTYLFFENKNGLNFVSLASLYELPVVRTFVQDNHVRDSIHAGRDDQRDIERDFSKIQKLNVPSAYDYLERIRNGAYSSTLITHDLLTKSYNATGYDFLNNTNDAKLNPYTSLTNGAYHSPNAAIAHMHKNNASLPGGNDITNSKIFQHRRALLTLVDSCKVEITVFGRTDYVVGQKVALELYQNKPLDKTDTNNIDNIFSGNYLISKIRHMITNTSHTCKMELIKDSFLMKV